MHDVERLREKTPAWVIHNTYYHVKVPEAAMISREERRRGSRRAGLNEADELEYAQSETDAHLTIMDMAEIWDSGYRVILVDPEASKHINDVIEKHLTMWEEALRGGRTLPGKKEDIDAVVEDLVKLDGFRFHIYSKALSLGHTDPARGLGTYGQARAGFVQNNPHEGGEPLAYQGYGDKIRLSNLKRRRKVR